MVAVWSRVWFWKDLMICDLPISRTTEFGCSTVFIRIAWRGVMGSWVDIIDGGGCTVNRRVSMKWRKKLKSSFVKDDGEQH